MFWKSARLRTALLVIVLGLPAFDSAVTYAQQPPRAAQDEFVPIDQLPQDETLPAARLLIAAYAVAWILVAAYLWSIWRRLGRVETELADVARRTQQNASADRPTGAGGGGRR